MTEQTNTPELRFPEFKNEWSLSTIGALGDFYYGKSAPKWSITEDVGIPCIRYGELYTKFNNVVKEIYSYSSMPKEKLRFSKGGEILIPRVGEDPLDFAKCVYLPQKDIAIGEMISVYNTKENPLFLTYYFNTKMKYEFAKRVEGASVSNLYYSYLEDIKLKIPDIREQEKLGEFFSKLDQQIELEEKKLELLEQQKKGYMQKIFSQELRFKDENENEYPNWKTTELKDILEKIVDNRGKTPDNTSNEKYPLLEVNALGFYYPSYKRVSKFVSENTYNNWFREHLKENDILFSTVGNTGIVSLMDNYKAVIAQNIVGLRVNNNNIPSFVYYMLSYWENQKKIKRIQMGAVQPSVKVSQFKFIKYLIPIKEEQGKIASLLSEIDKVINKQLIKIELLKQRKQGLLQKMFV
ncbi:restriction endonuclease subunit S [Staphylococcus epidermidis]|uniref:restriction endonuclease subunit S n=1 Tax=Staphylococcus epidermidis TaxID=1282 RepID=UPI001D0D6F04|nr:restriction endonuclease subunit S [Staphylococcus epidermidis]MCC2071315.1 restriction endonuclease subunit S [Staphylococcus epidermidis]